MGYISRNWSAAIKVTLYYQPNHVLPASQHVAVQVPSWWSADSWRSTKVIPGRLYTLHIAVQQQYFQELGYTTSTSQYKLLPEDLLSSWNWNNFSQFSLEAPPDTTHVAKFPRIGLVVLGLEYNIYGPVFILSHNKWWWSHWSKCSARLVVQWHPARTICIRTWVHTKSDTQHQTDRWQGQRSCGHQEVNCKPYHDT